jgi:hypothetical protein
MKRRAVLRSLLTVPAVAVLPLDAIAQETKPAPAAETSPASMSVADAAAESVVKTFNHAQFSALRRLGEILVPSAPETPGALEAGAAEFLDFLIGASQPDRVTLYREGLEKLNAEA